MIEHVVISSLMITGIWISFQSGNIFSFVRVWVANKLDRWNRKWSKYVQKPLWDCLPCMGGLWTVVLTWSFDIQLILAVIGLNVIVNKWVGDDQEERYTPVRGFCNYPEDVPTLRP